MQSKRNHVSSIYVNDIDERDHFNQNKKSTGIWGTTYQIEFLMASFGSFAQVRVSFFVWSATLYVFLTNLGVKRESKSLCRTDLWTKLDLEIAQGRQTTINWRENLASRSTCPGFKSHLVVELFHCSTIPSNRNINDSFFQRKYEQYKTMRPNVSIWKRTSLFGSRFSPSLSHLRTVRTVESSKLSEETWRKEIEMRTACHVKTWIWNSRWNNFRPALFWNYFFHFWPLARPMKRKVDRWYLWPRCSSRLSDRFKNSDLVLTNSSWPCLLISVSCLLEKLQVCHEMSVAQNEFSGKIFFGMTREANTNVYINGSFSRVNRRMHHCILIERRASIKSRFVGSLEKKVAWKEESEGEIDLFLWFFPFDYEKTRRRGGGLYLFSRRSNYIWKMLQN